MKNKSQRGISPRNSAAKKRISRRNFAAEHGEKSIPVNTHINQLTVVSRCFAAKKSTVTKIFLFKFNFNLDVFISFQVVSIFCFRFNFV